VALVLFAQVAVCIGISIACGENVEAGTVDDTMCDAASTWGYAVLLIVPFTVTLAGGVAGYMRRDRRILKWAVLGAVGFGMGVPWVASMVAGIE
jgi:hypothetical protein